MRLFRKRPEDRDLPAPNLTPGLPPYMGARAPLNVTTSNALRVLDFMACVQVKADSISTLPLHGYRRTEQGRVPAGPETPIVQLLERPSPGSTSVDLISQMVVHISVYGEAFVGKYRADGEIVQLGLLSPESVQVEQRGQRIVYTLDTPRGRVDVGPADVLHVKGMSSDGLRGISPVTQCRVALGLSSALAESARQFFESGSRPSGVLTVAGGAGSQEAADRISAAWQSKHAGVEQMHRVPVLTGDVTFHPIALSQEDAQFIEQRELSTREIARLARVPAWAIDGDTGSSLTYSNVGEQNRFLVAHSLRPVIVRIERAISGDADLCPGGVYVQFDLDGLLRADAKTRSETYTQALNAETGWLNRAEVRELEDLPPEAEVITTQETTNE